MPIPHGIYGNTFDLYFKMSFILLFMYIPTKIPMYIHARITNLFIGKNKIKIERINLTLFCII